MSREHSKHEIKKGAIKFLIGTLIGCLIATIYYSLNKGDDFLNFKNFTIFFFIGFAFATATILLDRYLLRK